MSKFFRYVSVVLWASIGLGGRRADAIDRVGQNGALPVIVIALLLVVIFVAGLIAVAHLAAA